LGGGEKILEKIKDTTIILIRHGECEGNIKGMFRGRSDFPLNKRGLAQARDLAKELKSFPIKYIFTSPLLRAMQTAELIACEHNLEIKIEAGLNNIELGSWEGRLMEEIASLFPREWDLWLNNPEKLKLKDMETLSEVQKRAKDCLDNLVYRHSGELIALVSHRAVLKPLVAACINISSPYFWKIHFDTASYSILTHRESRGYCLMQLNQNKHLKEYYTETA